MASSAADSHACIVCSKPAKFLCSSCGPPIFYCSTECQSNDWNNTHKSTCVAASQQPTHTSNSELSHHKRGRGNAAQAINAKRKGSITPADPVAGQSGSQEEHPLTPEEEAQDLKFYMEQVYLIIKPVIVCIILSIIWVKFTIPAGIPLN